MSTENEGLLEVRDLKVHFPLPKKSLFGERSYVKAVDGVSFRVRKGTTFGIVGESGSGKTTIAKAIMGLVGVSGGSIRLEGNELVGIPEDRLKALRPKYQIVFQDPYSSLNPRMRVGKIVQDPLNLMDLGSHEEREEREKEVFEHIGLHQAQRALFPHQFSGGQRQRISIGRALASYPELYVLEKTLAGMNEGKDIDTLASEIVLPQEYASLPYLGEYYGCVEWTVRAIFTAYLGWFDGNPTNLHPLPPKERAEKAVALAGGADAVLRAAEEAVRKGECQWCLELCDLLLTIGVNAEAARRQKAVALTKLAAYETSANGRHYYLVCAHELENRH